MAYNEFLADRVRLLLKEKGTVYQEKRMMGGQAFMVDDKMCVGIYHDKKSARNHLLCRLGEEGSKKALLQPGCSEMDFTGRPMKGFVKVDINVLDTEEELAHWIKLCLDFNPLAKSSKRKNKSS